MMWISAMFAAAVLAGVARGGTDSVARQHGLEAKVAPPAPTVLSCQDPPGSFEDSSAIGSWYLLHCFADQENSCTERNCLRFELITPQERKYLSATYAARTAAVHWDQVTMRLVTPCAEVKNITTPNYLERTAPGQYKLITLPVSAKDTRLVKPRPLRLQLLLGLYLVMLDCAELEPVVLVRQAPPPGYKEDPALAPLLALSEY